MKKGIYQFVKNECQHCELKDYCDEISEARVACYITHVKDIDMLKNRIDELESEIKEMKERGLKL